VDVGSSSSMPPSLSTQDIESEAKRGKTNSGAAAFILCPVPDDWTERLWLNQPSVTEPAPGPVTVSISLGLRDTPDPVSLPDYALAPCPALPRQKVGCCVAPLFNAFAEPDLVDWRA